MNSLSQILASNVRQLLMAMAFGVASQGVLAADLAPDFSQLPKDAKMVILPLDVELFELTAGGVLQPKADWTETANRLMSKSLIEKSGGFGVASNMLDEAKADEFNDYMKLMVAVAASVAIHHKGLNLPTKDGKLDWGFDDVLKPLAKASGSRYALFTWVRDSYATSERKAMMVGMALLGVSMVGGMQLGRATLIDMETGKVVWFNRLFSGTGDLRTEESAKKTVDELMNQFPKAQ